MSNASPAGTEKAPTENIRSCATMVTSAAPAGVDAATAAEAEGAQYTPYRLHCSSCDATEAVAFGTGVDGPAQPAIASPATSSPLVHADRARFILPPVRRRDERRSTLMYDCVSTPYHTVLVGRNSWTHRLTHFASTSARS